MKRFIAILIAFAMLLSLVAFADEGSQNYLLGDVNGDGNIDIMDALEILKYLAKIPSEIEDGNESFNAALITEGEKPQITDALQILMYCAKMTNMIDNKRIKLSETTTSKITEPPATTEIIGVSSPVESTITTEIVKIPHVTEPYTSAIESTTTTENDDKNGDNKNMQTEIVFVMVSFYPYFGVYANNPPESYRGYFIENNGNVRKFSFENVQEHWTFGTFKIDGSQRAITLNETIFQEALLLRLNNISEFEIIGNIAPEELDSYISLLSHVNPSVEIQVRMSTADVVQGYSETFGVRYDENNIAEIVFIGGVGGINFIHTDKNALELKRWLNELISANGLR